MVLLLIVAVPKGTMVPPSPVLLPEMVLLLIVDVAIRNGLELADWCALTESKTQHERAQQTEDTEEELGMIDKLRKAIETAAPYARILRYQSSATSSPPATVASASRTPDALAEVQCLKCTACGYWICLDYRIELDDNPEIDLNPD